MKKIFAAFLILASAEAYSRGWIAPNKPVTYIEANKDYIQFLVNGKYYIYFGGTGGSPNFTPETKSVIYSMLLTSFTSGKPLMILHDDKGFPGIPAWTVIELVALGQQQ